jgi:AcrR family transcriptional regulator
MLKSMGRSSRFLSEIVGGTVSPPCAVRKTNLDGERQALRATAGMASGPDLRRARGIDIPRAQTIVSYNCLKCNRPLQDFPDMASDHTRTAILNAAERLYADRGFGDVTLRDIVAAAGVNLAAVNYHFGSKDELIAELFVSRGLATNRERINELKAAEEGGGGRADIAAILRALVGPTLRGCLGPDRERSTAARFMIRASIEAVPPIRRIKNREIDHLRKFAAAMRRALPDCSEVDLYWGLHFALAMAHQTIRDSERLAKLSEGSCDLDDVDGIIERIVAVSVMALAGSEIEKRTPARLAARDER